MKKLSQIILIIILLFSTTLVTEASTKWNGNYSNSLGQLKISSQTTSKFNFSLKVSDGNHVGEVSGTATYKGTKASVKKVGKGVCDMTFTRTSTGVTLKENNCLYWHGAGIGFSGTYVDKVGPEQSRVTYTMKDAKGQQFKLYVIGTNEKKERASFNPSNSWANTWGKTVDGDYIYHGDYKLYIQKNGSKSMTYTGYQIKNYTYNETRKMMYSIPSKYKGQPSLFAIAQTESSRDESADYYYISNGKLKKVKGGLGYSLRPENTGKNLFRIADFNNADTDTKWIITSLSFNPSTGTFKYGKSKTYINNNKVVDNWRKDWR